MTRDEAVAVISGRLGDRTGLSTKTVEELKLAQARLERSAELPWFLLTLNTSLVTVAGTETVTVPTGFLREYEEISLFITDSNGELQRLEKSGLEGLMAEPNLKGSGRPTDYDLVGTKWYLRPIPNAVYSLRAFYYLADTVLSTNVENLWLANAPDVMIGEAGFWVARFLRDPEAAGYFLEYRNEGIRRMQIENVARKQAAATMFLGG